MKKRADVLLVEKNLAKSREKAKAMIIAGIVKSGDKTVSSPSDLFDETQPFTVTGSDCPYVSRGGLKLEKAIREFGIDLKGKICLDVGCSTGGFTDCMLQHGAGKVYAVDVGYGELHWKLRNDPRVVVMERTNARYVEGFPEPVALVTIDASFISLRILLPVVRGWLEERGGEVVALIKPQFEAGRAEVSRGDGVIQDPAIHRRVLMEILEYAREQGFAIRGLARSPLKGPKGNAEFLTHLEYPANTGQQQRIMEDLIDKAMAV